MCLHLAAGLIVGALSVTMYEVMAGHILRIFIAEPETVRLGTDFLRIRCLATPLMFMSFFTVYTFQGFGRGERSLFLGVTTELWIPVLNKTVDFGVFYYVLIFFVLVGTTNAVNLTDGLDGLGAALAAMAEAGVAMVYDTNHIILGKGNFVLSVSAELEEMIGVVFDGVEVLN